MRLELPVIYLGGAVVYARHNGEIYLALVHDFYKRWTVSKGKIESGENVEAGTIREIKEELGLNIAIQIKLDEKEHIATPLHKEKHRKHVTYFLAESSFQELTLEKSGGLNDAKWFKLSEVLDLKIYDDMRPLFEKAIYFLKK